MTGLMVSSLCRAEMFTAADSAGRRAAVNDSWYAVGEPRELGVASLVILFGGLPPGSRNLDGAREMVPDGLAEILDEASAANVTLALEPQHPVICADCLVVSTVAQALDTMTHWAPPSGAVDVWHIWWNLDIAGR